MPGAISHASRHYDLYIRTGDAGFYFRNDNHGVTLTGERIHWTFDGQEDGAPTTNIRSVHLQTGGGEFDNPMGVCRVTFADGHVLIVTSANDRGINDDERRPLYREFVHDLHARLAELPRGDISFTCGLQGMGYPLVVTCGVLLGVICVGVPVLALIATRSFGPLTVLFAGVGLYWPLITFIEKNAPRSYDPHEPPEELLE
jgi:hypothetical protein